jgi:hypothetical protein
MMMTKRTMTMYCHGAMEARWQKQQRPEIWWIASSQFLQYDALAAFAEQTA